MQGHQQKHREGHRSHLPFFRLRAGADIIPIVPSYDLELFADYHQFYLQDEKAKGDLSEAWTEKATADHLAIAPGTIGVGTLRNVTVPVLIEVLASEPEEDLDRWDQVCECSIEIPSGRLVVAGCTDYFPDATRISVAPGVYRARIYYAGLGTMRSALDADDHYRVVLWKAPPIQPRVLKRFLASQEG